MATIQIVLVIALLSSVLVHGDHFLVQYDPCALAYLECDWEFFGPPGKIPIFSVHSKPNRAFTPRVISKNPKEKIGILNTNGIISEFIRGKYAMPITKFGNPRFTPTHFKTFSPDCFMGSGVGHETFHGNQEHLARNQCVRIFFTTYQKLTYGDPPMVDNINVYRNDYKCVVFRLH